MNKIQEKIARIKEFQESFKESESRMAELKGRAKELLSRLDREFGIKSIEKGNELHDDMCDRLEKAEAELDGLSDGLDELMKKSGERGVING